MPSNWRSRVMSTWMLNQDTQSINSMLGLVINSRTLRFWMLVLVLETQLCLFLDNPSNKVVSYNIVEEGASNISKDNITWKVMDFRKDPDLNLE